MTLLRIECNLGINRSAGRIMWLDMSHVEAIRIDHNHNHIHLFYHNRNFKVPITDHNMREIEKYIKKEKMKK